MLHEPSGPSLTSEFEHSSIPATLKKIFNLKDFLTKRDAWAGTFEGVVNRNSPRTDCPITLPEPQKMRETDAQEDAELSEFQQELVQLAAVFKGDLTRDIFPDKILEKMTVAGGLKYVEDAFKKFTDDCKKARESGADESDIVLLPKSKSPTKTTSRTFVQKVFSCLVCDN